jgi:hypothetical protein
MKYKSMLVALALLMTSGAAMAAEKQQSLKEKYLENLALAVAVAGPNGHLCQHETGPEILPFWPAQQPQPIRRPGMAGSQSIAASAFGSIRPASAIPAYDPGRSKSPHAREPLQSTRDRAG